ncbi:MAG TPA: poly(hydroxyalkanoate) granule-associated protein, partial [Alcanivorax sp.]|nr:poly(hydroxyalkanoate) granule-associated protein [Alcanivorax sp.]
MSDQEQNQNEKDGRQNPLKALSGASRDIRKYTHQIWLAGLGAFARAEEEGSGFFDALVEAGREVERHTKDKTES